MPIFRFTFIMGTWLALFGLSSFIQEKEFSSGVFFLIGALFSGTSFARMGEEEK